MGGRYSAYIDDEMVTRVACAEKRELTGAEKRVGRVRAGSRGCLRPTVGTRREVGQRVAEGQLAQVLKGADCREGVLSVDL